MELSKVVTDIRVNWAISDAKRDEGLTTPEDVLRMDDISYGPYGEENRMDIYMPKGTTKPLPTIVKESFSENFPKQLDVWNYMNSDFPPAFITTSEHDFLKDYAKPMYEHLHALGVPCELRKYGSLDQPEIAHVFHVNCKLEEAKRCNDEECAFFERFIK